MDQSPQASPSRKAAGKESGGEAYSGRTIRFGRQEFRFRERPIAAIAGEHYISASDPDFKAMFDAMGLTYSWFSYSGKLFIYLPQGSVSWQINDNYAMVGSRRVDVPVAGCGSNEDCYIPLKTLARLLDLQIRENGSAVELRPAVSFAAYQSSGENTIDIHIQAPSELKYGVSYQANPPAVRFTIPGAAYNGSSRKIFVEGIQVRVNDTIDPNNLFVTMEFPPHWKGRIVDTINKNQVVVRMKPNLVYAWGSKDCTLSSVQLTQSQGQVHLLFNTSGSAQYYWSYDPDEGILYVDMPFVAPSPSFSLAGISGGLVKNCRVSTLRPDDVSITRLRMELAPNTAFMIGPPEDQKGCSFALLLADKRLIPSPSPRVGGSGITMADGDTGGLIVIDPGHGGSDPGACNAQLGLKEKDITLDISRQLADILSRQGWKVILTRYQDTDLTYPGSPDADELQARCDVANQRRADLFVSIHCNASVSKTLKGSSYHWCKSIDQDPARALEGSLGPNIGTVDKGVRQDRFYVLNHTRIPAVLVECAFMSNPDDIQILARSEHRLKIAQQLARSIDYFLKNRNLARRQSNTRSIDE
jgi:N-acetylmuramoyl-L-alanine amidase